MSPKINKILLTSTALIALSVATPASAYDFDSSGGNTGGVVDLASGENLNITGNGNGNPNSNFTNVAGGANEMTVNLDAPSDTVTVGGSLTDIEVITITQGDVTMGGSITGADDIDIAVNGAFTTASVTTLTNDIDVVAGTFTSGGTINANAINVTNNGSANLNDDQINANVNVQSSNLEFNASTVFNGDVTIGGSGANIITSNGADLTQTGDTSTLYLTNTGGGTGNFGFGFDGGAGANNVLDISGDRNYNFNSSTIQGYETINFTSSATTTFNNTDFSGTNDINITGSGSLVFDEADDAFTVGGDINLGDGDGDNPTLDISGQTVTANSINVQGNSVFTFTGATIAADIDFDTSVQFTATGSDTIQLGDGGHTFTLSGDAGGSTAMNNGITGGAGNDTVDFATTAGTYNFNADITNIDTISFSSDGNVNLNGALSQINDINITSGGTLTIDETDDTFTITNNINLGDGDADNPTLDISGQDVTANSININGGTLTVDGTTNIDADMSISTSVAHSIGNLNFDDATGNQLTFTGDASFDNYSVNFDGGSGLGDEIVFNTSASSNVIFSDITGFETLSQTGAGATFLNGGSLNDVDTIDIDAGNLQINDSDNSFSVGSSVTIDGGGELNLSGQTITVGGTGIELNDGTLRTNSSATIDSNLTVNTQTGTTTQILGSLDFGDASGQTLTFDGDAGGTNSFNNAIDGDTGTDEIDLATSAGTLTLSGAISNIEIITASGAGNAQLTGALSGVEDIDVTGAGVLTIDEADDTFSVTNDIDVTNGGGINLTGQTVTANSINISNNSSQVSFDGATVNSDLDFDSGIVSIDGTTVFNGNIDFDTSGTLAMGSGTVTQGAGDNSMTFSGDGSGTVTAVLDESYDGGAGTNTFNFSQTGGSIDLSGSISNYQTINVDGGATTTVGGTITDATAINVSNNSIFTFDGSSLNGARINIDGGSTFTYDSAAALTSIIASVDTGETEAVNLNAAGDYSGSSIDLGSGAGTDQLNINATGGVTLGAVSNIEETVFGTNANVTLTQDVSLGNLQHDSTGQMFNTTVDANGDAHTLTLTGIIPNGDMTVNVTFADFGALEAGDQITLITLNGAGTSLSGTFDFSSTNTNQFYSLVEDTTTNDIFAINVAKNNVYQNSTTVEGNKDNLDSVTDAVLGSNTGNADLNTLRQTLLATTTADGAEDVVETVTPTLDQGFLIGGFTTSQETTQIIDGRLGGLRTGSSSGDHLKGLEFWTQAFGQYAEQDERQNIKGYDSDTFGAAFGADTNRFHENLRVGAAFSYGKTDVDSNGANQTQTDIDSYQATLYGEYSLEKDYFVTGSVSYTYNDIDQVRYNVGGANTASANYSSDQYGIGASFGRDIVIDEPRFKRAFVLTPQLNADYVYVDVESYDEVGAGGLSLNNVSNEALEHLDIGVSVDAEWTFVHDNGGFIKPSLSAGYSYAFVNDNVATTAEFAGGSASFETQGFEPGRNTVNVGAGVSYEAPNNWTFTSAYDYEAKSDYDAHSGLVKAKYKF